MKGGHVQEADAAGKTLGNLRDEGRRGRAQKNDPAFAGAQRVKVAAKNREQRRHALGLVEDESVVESGQSVLWVGMNAILRKLAAALARDIDVAVYLDGRGDPWTRAEAVADRLWTVWSGLP